MPPAATLLLIICSLAHGYCWSQHRTAVDATPIPGRFISQIAAQSDKLSSVLEKKTEKTLASMKQQEEQLYKRTWKLDSVKAKQVFADVAGRYQQLKQQLLSGDTRNYIPTLDSLSTALKFLAVNPQMLESSSETGGKLQEALERVEGLKEKFGQAEQVTRFLNERKENFDQQLQGLGVARELKKINKQAYYYQQQVANYKRLLKDPKNVSRRALELLSQTRPFQDFMRRHGQLASLFRVPGGADPLAVINLAGLQTRTQVNGLIQQQLGGGGPAAMTQARAGIQDAQGQLSAIKDKIIKAGGGSSEDIQPDGFKPNHQKTKLWLDRLELGANLQSTRGTGMLPSSTDLGLSAGYRLTDDAIAGLGASYRFSLGQDLRHLKLRHMGVGLRSFVDLRLKASFWITGGYERNYQQSFREIAELREISGWQESGLLGLTKTVSLKTRMLNKTKLQLLWDFLSYSQAPQTQPLLFRVNYNFR